METKDILKPRFKLIAEYPDCYKHNLVVGDIISFDYFNDEYNQWYNDNGKSKTYDAYYDAYPHLFKKLQWWEDRKEEDMPRFLKLSIHGSTLYFEIESWDMQLMVGWLCKENRTCCDMRVWAPEYTYQPATEEEFLNHYLYHP